MDSPFCPRSRQLRFFILIWIVHWPPKCRSISYIFPFVSFVLHSHCFLLVPIPRNASRPKARDCCSEWLCKYLTIVTLLKTLDPFTVVTDEVLYLYEMICKRRRMPEVGTRVIQVTLFLMTASASAINGINSRSQNSIMPRNSSTGIVSGGKHSF